MKLSGSKNEVEGLPVTSKNEAVCMFHECFTTSKNEDFLYKPYTIGKKQ